MSQFSDSKFCVWLARYCNRLTTWRGKCVGIKLWVGQVAVYKWVRCFTESQQPLKEMACSAEGQRAEACNETLAHAWEVTQEDCKQSVGGIIEIISMAHAMTFCIVTVACSVYCAWIPYSTKSHRITVKDGPLSVGTRNHSLWTDYHEWWNVPTFWSTIQTSSLMEETLLTTDALKEITIKSLDRCFC
jgi:hypothetical protein